MSLLGGLIVTDATAQPLDGTATAPGTAPSEAAGNLDLARSVAVTGREAFNAGDYETALALFRRAYALFPAPTLGLYEARSLQQMGLLIEALGAYSKTVSADVATDAPPQFAQAIDQARQEARALEARIPTLTLQVKGVSSHDPSLEVSINGRAIGAAQLGQAQRLNPGRYRVRGAVRAERVDESETILAEGQNVTLVLNLGAPSLTPPAPRETAGGETEVDLSDPSAPASGSSQVLAYVAGGVGVAGVGAGVVTGLMASSKHAQAKKLCPEDQCLRGGEGAGAASSFQSLRTVSTVSYAVGAAGLATGVILLLTGSGGGSGEQLTASVEPWGSGCRFGISGSF